jgi:Transposase DDE domain
MERELRPIVYPAPRDAARGVEPKYVRRHPWAVAAVPLRAAIHDRPVSWACRAENWSTTRLRPAAPPSAATVSRRARRAAFGVFPNLVADRLRGDGPPARELVVDGKPPVVGGCSKDPDAKRGRAAGGFARGYKLHAAWGDRCLPGAWAVTPLNAHEGAVAVGLLAGVSGEGVLLAAGSYEASRVYDAAAASGYQLLAPPDPGDNGAGHRYQSPHRRVALGWFRDGLGWDLYRERASIERMFGNAGSFAGGLGPLPARVRRAGRVERWVWAKLVINAARILRRRPLQRLQ